MKTLAPLVIVCLGLLALVVWSISRGVATDAQPRLRDSLVQRSPPGRAPSTQIAEPTEGPRPADSAPSREPEKPAENLPSFPEAATRQTAADEAQAAPPAATQAMVHWATGARQRRAKERFIELCETLVSDPYNEAALQAALELARALEWHNETCDLLGRLVRLRPEDVTLRFELATLLMRLERWLEAIPQLRRIVGGQPGNVRAWYNLAIAHQALGHLHDARATWDRVIELAPRNADAFAHRGEVLLDLRAWSAAAADFETALRLERGSVDVAMNLSLALCKLGRLDGAWAALLPVLRQHPQHVPLLNRLAEIAWALYQADPVANEAASDDALNYCLRSLAVDADQPEIKSLLERALQVGE